MRTKNKNKFKKKVFKALILALIFAGIFFFVKMKKEALIREFTRFVQTSLSQGMGLDVKIGRISGQLLGHVKIEHLVVQKPWLEESQRTVFSAEEVDLSYRFLDLISKEFNSKIVVVVTNSVFYWNPQVGVRKPSFPFMDWMKDWALTRKENIVVDFKNMTLVLGTGKRVVRGIDMSYQKNSVSAEIPLSHMAFGALDVSSVLKIEGEFQNNFMGVEDAVKGKIHTEASVINWKPLPFESGFDFVFSKHSFEILSSDFVGGIELKGKIDFEKDYDLEASVKAKEFSVANMELLLNTASRSQSPLRIDLDVSFTGNPWAPMVNGRARIFGGSVGRHSFRAMDVNVSGVYPTVQLENSRILMDDGITLRFANKVLEVRDLFKSKTYESLVTEAEQDTVIWGDWEFNRPKMSDGSADLRAQQSAADPSSVQLRGFGSGDKSLDPADLDKDKAELGFSYRLRSKDSVKVTVSENEEFVGVERKLRF